MSFWRKEPPRIALIDLGGIGLGDCVACVLTLCHLRQEEAHQFADGCVVRVPPSLLGPARLLLESRGLRVRAAGSGDAVGTGLKVFPRAPRGLLELIRQLLGRAVYLNWDEGYRLAVAWDAGHAHAGILKRLRFAYLELTQFKTTAPRTSAPLYVGFRILFPLLARSRRTIAAHMIRVTRTLAAVRGEMARYCADLGRTDPRLPATSGKVVVFAGAASFNAIPIFVCEKLQKRFPGQVVFAFHETDLSAAEAVRVLQNVTMLRTVEDTLLLICRNYAVCVDSFVSHLVQTITDDALIIYTRELSARFTHPGARPALLEIYPECAPCPYKIRTRNALCPAGHPYCIAFDSLYPLLEAKISQALASARV